MALGSLMALGAACRHSGLRVAQEPLSPLRQQRIIDRVECEPAEVDVPADCRRLHRLQCSDVLRDFLCAGERTAQAALDYHRRAREARGQLAYNVAGAGNDDRDRARGEGLVNAELVCVLALGTQGERAVGQHGAILARRQVLGIGRRDDAAEAGGDLDIDLVRREKVCGRVAELLGERTAQRAGHADDQADRVLTLASRGNRTGLDLHELCSRTQRDIAEPCVLLEEIRAVIMTQNRCSARNVVQMPRTVLIAGQGGRRRLQGEAGLLVCYPGRRHDVRVEDSLKGGPATHDKGQRLRGMQHTWSRLAIVLALLLLGRGLRDFGSAAAREVRPILILALSRGV
eukprot:m.46098 g.46098  ORF g.46098 m.46098 type:complete len:344 (-) comp5910_c0_seq2:774-1805(-)